MNAAAVFSSLRILIIPVMVFILPTGCDYIDNPDGDGTNQTVSCENNPPQFTPRPNPVKKVLLEDFTGHRCGNCPRAGETLKALKQQYGERLIGIAHHSEYSIPYTVPMSGPKYTYDYRTETAKSLDEKFGISTAGLPKGLVNRKPDNGNYVISHTKWGQLISNLLAEAPQADLQIVAEYTSSDSNVCVYVNVRQLMALPASLRLCVYLTENDFINWQKDYEYPGEDIENYNHSFLLRRPISSIWGTAFGSEVFELKTDTTFYYGFKFDPGKWVSPNCRIISFLYDGENGEVIQAEEIKLTP